MLRSIMWWTVFLGLAAVALADQTADPAPSKRDSQRGNVVIYDSSTGSYVLQEQTGAQTLQGQPVQYVAESQSQQHEDNYRKPHGAVLPFPQDRRPQYISNVPLTVIQQFGHSQGNKQPQAVEYEQPSRLNKGEHANYYSLPERPQQLTTRTQARTQHQQQQQFVSSGIVGATAGSFEEELAQLVAANRAQEHKYRTVTHVPGAQLSSRKHIQAPVKETTAAPQQYLKEITRPVSRPAANHVKYQTQPRLHQHPVGLEYESESTAPLRGTPVPLLIPQNHLLQTRVQPKHAARPLPQLYRYVYQPDLQSQVKTTVHNEQPSEPQPSLPQYDAAHEYIKADSVGQLGPVPQAGSAFTVPTRQGQSDQERHGVEHRHEEAREHALTQQYELQRQYVIKPQLATLPDPGVAERPKGTDLPVDERLVESVPETVPSIQSTPVRIPTLRIPGQRGKPLTQQEFQRLLQLGGYTATLLPSSHNSPTQEYLLQPKYTLDPQQPRTQPSLRPRHQHSSTS